MSWQKLRHCTSCRPISVVLLNSYLLPILLLLLQQLGPSASASLQWAIIIKVHPHPSNTEATCNTTHTHKHTYITSPASSFFVLAHMWRGKVPIQTKNEHSLAQCPNHSHYLRSPLCWGSPSQIRRSTEKSKPHYKHFPNASPTTFHTPLILPQVSFSLFPSCGPWPLPSQSHFPSPQFVFF